MGRLMASGTIQAGDLIFFTGTSWEDKAIQRFSDGPLTHVEVVWRRNDARGNVVTIGALNQGIVAHVLNPPYFLTASTGATLSDAGRTSGLSWLRAQIGSHYSFSDILVDAVQRLLPRALGSRTPFLVAPHRYDCSELAARFLLHAGYVGLPNEIADYPERCSPNSLARALGILKP